MLTKFPLGGERCVKYKTISRNFHLNVLLHVFIGEITKASPLFKNHDVLPILKDGFH